MPSNYDELLELNLLPIYPSVTSLPNYTLNPTTYSTANWNTTTTFTIPAGNTITIPGNYIINSSLTFPDNEIKLTFNTDTTLTGTI